MQAESGQPYLLRAVRSIFSRLKIARGRRFVMAAVLGPLGVSYPSDFGFGVQVPEPVPHLGRPK